MIETATNALERDRPLRWLAARWLVVAAAVTLGWLAGLVEWGPPVTGFHDIDFWYAPAVVMAPALPALVASAWLLASRSAWRKLGVVGIVVSALGAAYVAFLSHFGSICFDPEDVCNVTWPSRVAALGAGLVTAAIGFAVESGRHRRVARPLGLR